MSALKVFAELANKIKGVQSRIEKMLADPDGLSSVVRKIDCLLDDHEQTLRRSLRRAEDLIREDMVDPERKSAILREVAQESADCSHWLLLSLTWFGDDLAVLISMVKEESELCQGIVDLIKECEDREGVNLDWSRVHVPVRQDVPITTSHEKTNGRHLPWDGIIMDTRSMSDDKIPDLAEIVERLKAMDQQFHIFKANLDDRDQEFMDFEGALHGLEKRLSDREQDVLAPEGKLAGLEVKFVDYDRGLVLLDKELLCSKQALADLKEELQGRVFERVDLNAKLEDQHREPSGDQSQLQDRDCELANSHSELDDRGEPAEIKLESDDQQLDDFTHRLGSQPPELGSKEQDLFKSRERLPDTERQLFDLHGELLRPQPEGRIPDQHSDIAGRSEGLEQMSENEQGQPEDLKLLGDFSKSFADCIQLMQDLKDHLECTFELNRPRSEAQAVGADLGQLDSSHVLHSCKPDSPTLTSTPTATPTTSTHDPAAAAAAGEDFHTPQRADLKEVPQEGSLVRMQKGSTRIYEHTLNVADARGRSGRVLGVDRGMVRASSAAPQTAMRSKGRPRLKIPMLLAMDPQVLRASEPDDEGQWEKASDAEIVERTVITVRLPRDINPLSKFAMCSKDGRDSPNPPA